MGYTRHHTIVVTCWDVEKILPAHLEARVRFDGTTAHVSEVTPPAMNGYVSFLVAPDGSKEGWANSDEAEEAREQFIAWLDAQRYSDDSTWLDWVEVQFGDDEGETRIVRDSDEKTRA